MKKEIEYDKVPIEEVVEVMQQILTITKGFLEMYGYELVIDKKPKDEKKR